MDDIEAHGRFDRYGAPVALRRPPRLGAEFVATAPERGVRLPSIRPGRAAIAIVLVLAIGAGAFVGTKLFSLRGTGDVLEHVVPADATVYATVYLDPAFSQKLALRDLVSRFPAARGGAQVGHLLDHALDDAFRGSGLRFERDVRPWLGSQLGVVVRVDGAGAELALLIRTTDDAAATRAVARLRATSDMRGASWSTTVHDGVTITTGSPRHGDPSVDAFVDHTAVLGTSAGLVESIVDAATGKAPNIESSAQYGETMRHLPARRLGAVYVDMTAIARLVKRRLPAAALACACVDAALGRLGAYRGLGIALTAAPDGVVADVYAGMDATRLDAATRAALAAPPHANAVTRWVPADAFGFSATTSAGPSATGALPAILGSGVEAQHVLRTLELGKGGGFESHLTGDAVVEAQPAPPGESGGVAAAVVLGSQDPKATAHSLESILDVYEDRLHASGNRTAWHSERHRGVAISWYTAARSDSPDELAPAVAAVDGAAIVATTPRELERVLDAHAAGRTITSSPAYVAATAHALVPSAGGLFVSVESILGAVRTSLPPSARRAFDAGAGPNLTPLRAVTVTEQHALDHEAARVFVRVG